MNITDSVEKLIKPVIEENNYQLEEVLYIKENGIMFLRIVIDKMGIVDIDDCVNVTKLINPLLDEKDLIKENYVLDVCSKEKGCD